MPHLGFICFDSFFLLGSAPQEVRQEYEALIAEVLKQSQNVP